MSQLSYPPPFRPLGDEEVSIDEEPVDTGLIRCICDSTEDDGFTIQCDKCLTWQHAFCMKINSKNIPDRYLCSLCDKRPVPSNAGMHKKRPVSKPSGANSTTTTTTPSTSNASTPINAVTKRTTRTDDEYKTVKKPKLSKRIAVPKSQMDRSALYDHSNNQHHQLHHAHSPQNDPSESGSVSRASSPRPAARKRFHHTASTHVCSKFVRQVLHEATEKWARHPKWRSAPWRPSDQQEESLLQMEPFTVVDASSFGAPTPFALKPVPKPGAHRVASKLKKGAFADTQLYANTFLIEAHGDLLLKSEFKFDAANDYALLGTPCAHVLFYPTLDLCMDARHRGNDARHFRRSCHPNAEIRVMVCPSSMASNANANSSSSSSSASASSSTSHSFHSSNNNTRIVRLGIFTRSVIQPNEEITLGWHWQKGHVAWRKHVEWVRSSQDDFHPRDDELAMDEAAAPHLRAAMDAMLQRFEAEFGDCACGDRDVCLIDRLRQECYQGGVVTTPTTTPQGSFRHHRPASVSRQTSTGSIEKTGTTIAHAPAPASMSLVPPSISATSAAAAIADENVDVDVISMSPSAANTPKKDATDDEGDIDIDIGDDLPTSSTAIEDNDDEKKTKAALPFKKAWARHYQKQDGAVIKHEDEAGEPMQVDEKVDTKAASAPSDAPSTPAGTAPEEPHVPQEPMEPQEPSMVETKDQDTAMLMDDDDDDGNMSDASSASTLPLDPEDEAERTEPFARPDPLPEAVIKKEPEESDHMANANANADNEPKDTVMEDVASPSSPQDAPEKDQPRSSASTPPPPPTSTVADKDQPMANADEIKQTSDDIPVNAAPHASPPPPSPPRENTKDATITTTITTSETSSIPATSDEQSSKGEDESTTTAPPQPTAKPNKVKMSLQEYLSRRMEQQQQQQQDNKD